MLSRTAVRRLFVGGDQGGESALRKYGTLQISVDVLELNLDSHIYQSFMRSKHIYGYPLKEKEKDQRCSWYNLQARQ